MRCVHLSMCVGMLWTHSHEKNDVQLDEEVRKVVKSRKGGKGVRVLELGTFCGYGGRFISFLSLSLSLHTHTHTHTHTAIRVGSWLKEGDVLISVEYDDSCVYCEEMIELAGLSSKITVMRSDSSSAIAELARGGGCLIWS